MRPAILLASLLAAAPLFAAGHTTLGVSAMDQDVSGGTVVADSVVAPANGWMVVHRTDADRTPGPVVGHAPLRAGANAEVTAILTEDVTPGDMLMLMIHGEDGGTQTGIFEYTLGAPEDGPYRLDGDLVMTVITAQ
ncbi:DUF7282 domain-containing protein [Pontivivens ytuae]|uniref:DUF7282 domain-containing protein n=1 Tax=Pontivivens ytuae TaxID=2789856 RepID=A0A7S9QCL8_9RHOB|nr:hypothetical protein [Pontivivens ytuae]QPH54363.1 hypothetical protein I0K15_00855 [Pontivivens ytuae]